MSRKVYLTPELRMIVVALETLLVTSPNRRFVLPDEREIEDYLNTEE